MTIEELMALVAKLSEKAAEYEKISKDTTADIGDRLVASGRCTAYLESANMVLDASKAVRSR